MIRTFILSLFVLAVAACGGADSGRGRADPELDRLFLELGQAEDVTTAQGIEERVWRRWADSGSPTVNVLLERAAAAETAGDAEMAERFLDQASALAPDFAEPWNRRASLAYRSDDYAGAIAALQETLKREPRHFGALAVLGLIYEELGQDRRALAAFRAALVIHPYHQPSLDGVRRIEPRVEGREA